MASTNKTTNYELSQFVETDRPAWLTDYNSDMRKIDSNLKEVSDIADGASSSISELADRMSTAEGNITTNTNDIAALDARADALEAGAQSTAGTIANIQTEQTAQNMGIEAATELGYNLARPYDSASTYAVGAYVLFQNTLYKCVTAVPTGEAFDPTKWLAIKATDEIAAGGYTLPVASDNILGGVMIGNGLDILNGILSVKADITRLTSSNFQITPTSSAAYVSTNVFGSGTPSETTNMLSNVSITADALSFYAKCGNLRILYLDLEASFDALTLNSKNVVDFVLTGNIVSDIIDHPARTSRSQSVCGFGDYGMYNSHVVITPSGGITFDYSYYNAAANMSKSSISSTNGLCIIYYVE